MQNHVPTDYRLEKCTGVVAQLKGIDQDVLKRPAEFQTQQRRRIRCVRARWLLVGWEITRALWPTAQSTQEGGASSKVQGSAEL